MRVSGVTIGLVIASASLACSRTPTGVPGVEVSGLDELTHRPLVVMSRTDQYDHGQGNRAPTFTLFDDGLVIYQRTTGDRFATMSGNVGRGGAAALLRDLIDDGLFAAPACANVANATDQPTTTVLLRIGPLWHRWEVYGLNRDGKVSVPPDERPSTGFVAAMRRLMSFEAPGASPWKPEQIEIDLLPAAGYPPGPVHPWPATVPTPEVRSTAPYVEFVTDRVTTEDARRAFASGGSYTLGGTSWRVHVWGGVVPGQQHIAEVDRQLRNIKSDR